MALSDEEYEDAYREALFCLAEAVSVSKPFIDASGRRVCDVGGVLLDDDQVLERWWGEDVLEKIHRQHKRGPFKVRSIRSE